MTEKKDSVKARVGEVDDSADGGLFGKINLKAEVHVVAPGNHRAVISGVRLVKSRDEKTLWLFISLDIHNGNGEVLGQVEERFMTIAARGDHPHVGRVREGLKRLALYADAANVELDGVSPDAIAGLLIGKRIRAVINRYGTGVQAENKIGLVTKDED